MADPHSGEHLIVLVRHDWRPADTLNPVSLLIILLVMVALISSCVVYVVLRDRRTSGNRTRFEPGRQDAPVTEEAGMNLQGYWSGNITP